MYSPLRCEIALISNAVIGCLCFCATSAHDKFSVTAEHPLCSWLIRVILFGGGGKLTETVIEFESLRLLDKPFKKITKIIV